MLSAHAAVMTARAFAELTRAIAATYVRALFCMAAFVHDMAFLHDDDRAIIAHVRSWAPGFAVRHVSALRRWIVLRLRQWAERGKQCGNGEDFFHGNPLVRWKSWIDYLGLCLVCRLHKHVFACRWSGSGMPESVYGCAACSVGAWRAGRWCNRLFQARALLMPANVWQTACCIQEPFIEHHKKSIFRVAGRHTLHARRTT